MKFLISLLVNAVIFLLCAYLIPGVAISGLIPAVFAALVVGGVNFFIRPILTILTLPITIFTFGLFLLVVNGLMILLAAAIVPGFSVTGILPAIGFVIILAIANWIIGKNDRN